ncbi:hypothetical protein ABMA58_06660 [Oceanospirillum sp. HFRX-1_2]
MVRSLGLGIALAGFVFLTGCSSAAEDYARAKAEAERAREQKASQQEQQLRRDADNAFKELDKQ